MPERDDPRPSTREVAAEEFLFHLHRGSELLQDNRVHAAKAELERARPLPPSSPYIAPRPIAFRDPRPGPSWQLRAGAALAVVAVLLILLQLLFGLF